MSASHVMKDANALLKMPLFVGLAEAQLKLVIEAGRVIKLPVRSEERRVGKECRL